MENVDDIRSPEIPARRPVPWTGPEVALLFLLWALLVSVSSRTVFELAGVALTEEVFAKSEDAAQTIQPTTRHPLTQFLQKRRESPVFLWIALFSAVIAAPLAEEFFYRLILQGWVEKAAGPLRKIGPVFAVLFVSILFAAVHGGTRVERPVDFLFCALLGVGIGHVLAVSFAWAYLRFLYGKSVLNFLWSSNAFRDDVRRVGFAFLLAIPTVLGLNAWVQMCFPETVTDPVPIFLLSIILGTVFYRTGRVFPCIALHALFNGFSFALAIL